MISIVATLYNSAPYLDEFYRRATETALKLGGDYEIVFVNDGSPDDSLKRAVRLCEADERVQVIDLSRNFGHHKAMMTGLIHARGDLVFLIDSDLEEEPEWLLSFAEKMRSNQCDVVYGVQARRKGGLFERWSGGLFYSLFRMLTGLDFPENMVTARLMSRRYVDALIQFEEREVFLPGLWHITGFEQLPYTVRKHSTSRTNYTFRKKAALAVNSITSFTNTPLIAIFYLGAFISLVSSLYIGFLLGRWMFFANPPLGWTSTMASIWLIGGLVILFIGIVGIYLSKVFFEAKQRPYTIIRQVFGKGRGE